MARIYPDPMRPTSSTAEKRLYRLFQDELSDAFIVIHGARWIAKKPQQKTNGEVDFLVIHPELGILLLEVKGGGIRVERDTWYSRDASGELHVIKDPVHQVQDSLYALRDHLGSSRLGHGSSIYLCHGVVFPDVVITQVDLRPDIPRDIVIDGDQLRDINSAIQNVFKYWHRMRPPKSVNAWNSGQVVDLLAPTRELRSRIAFEFEAEERQLKQLTEDQFSVLDLLTMHPRAVIVGGAGTGKTMLAVEKARRLADAGFRVLLLCYNVNLSDWLKTALPSDSHVTISTFHSLAADAAMWTETRPSSDLQDWAPELLLDAALRARVNDELGQKLLFDAIVVDEGQDFPGHYWTAVVELLKHREDGVLYVFLDENQSLRGSLPELPISIPPFPLLTNCRNTKSVFSQAEQYATVVSSASRKCIGPSGRDIEFIQDALSERQLKEQLRVKLHDLVRVQGVSPHDIVILTPREPKDSCLKNGTELGTFILDWDLRSRIQNHVHVSSISKFKGLERPVVIAAELSDGEVSASSQELYIAFSRARNHLVVLGTIPKPNS